MCFIDPSLPLLLRCAGVYSPTLRDASFPYPVLFEKLTHLHGNELALVALSLSFLSENYTLLVIEDMNSGDLYSGDSDNSDAHSDLPPLGFISKSWNLYLLG